VTKVRLHHGQVSEEYLDQRYGRSFRRSYLAELAMSAAFAEVTPISSALIMQFRVQRAMSPHWLSP